MQRRQRDPVSYSPWQTALAFLAFALLIILAGILPRSENATSNPRQDHLERIASVSADPSPPEPGVPTGPALN